jgi:hypothetical protein
MKSDISIVRSSYSIQELMHLLRKKWSKHQCYLSESRHKYEKYVFEFFSSFWSLCIDLPWSLIIDEFIDLGSICEGDIESSLDVISLHRLEVYIDFLYIHFLRKSLDLTIELE